jgi:hypothetical protein
VTAQLSDLEREYAEAVAKTRTLEAAREQHLTAAEQNRRRRREQVWRQQLADLEAVDTAAAIAEAKKQLAAAIRGDVDVSPVRALYARLVAEQRAVMVARSIVDRRQQLGLAAGAVPQSARLDPIAELGKVLEAEAARLIAGEAAQLVDEIEEAWRDEDLPARAAAADPSAYLRRQDQVARARQIVADAREQLAGAEDLPPDDLRRKSAIAGARSALTEAEHRAADAERELVEFQAGGRPVT